MPRRGEDEARRFALHAPAPRLHEEGLARLRGGGGARRPPQPRKSDSQLPRRRMAAQLFRADEGTLQPRTLRSCRCAVRAWKEIRTRTSKLEVWFSSQCVVARS